METIITLDNGVPQVPRGFTLDIVEIDGQEVIAAIAPKDTRKSRGRVPAVPKRWFLMTKDDNKHFWIPENDFPTRTIREFMLAQGLEMEVKHGMRMTNKAPKCSTILRQEYGMKGKPEDLLEQFIEFRQIELHPPKGIFANKELR